MSPTVWRMHIWHASNNLTCQILPVEMVQSSPEVGKPDYYQSGKGFSKLEDNQGTPKSLHSDCCRKGSETEVGRMYTLCSTPL